jgi:hypothetical protein
VIAYDYPLLGVFWTMLYFFIWVAWLMLLFRIFGDIFRNDDMGGFAKAMWSIFVIIVPFLGVLIYMVVNGKEMAGRDLERAQAAQNEFQTYVRTVADTGSSADELTKLAALRDQGVLTEAEFSAQKAKLLA